MGIDSELRNGRTTNLTVFGPGPKQGSQILAVGPTGTPFPIAVPANPKLVGVRLGLHTLVVANSTIPAGGLTNAMLPTVGR